MPRILVADDDATVRALLTELLRHELGAEVDAVGDGLAAMAALTSHTYDAALLDHRMPRADGFAVLRWLSGRPRGAQVPAVVCTGSMETAETEALRLGAAACIAKPFDLDDVVATLRPFLPAAKHPRRTSGTRPA